MKCSKLVHKGGRYARLDNAVETLCLNCSERIDDIDRLSVLLT